MSFPNVLKDCDNILCFKWGEFVVKLEKKNSQAPNVDFVCVLFVLENFRSHVLISSAKSLSLLLLNCPTEVTDLYTFILC